MGRVIIGKFKVEESELKPILVKAVSRAETQFCMKCGLSTKLIILGTGTICGACNTELTWQ